MMTAAVADNPSATMSTAFMPLYYLKRSKGAVKASFQERQWRRRSASSASASHWAARSSSSALILGSRARCAICRHLSALRRQRSAMSAGASILADAIPTAGVRSSGISGRPLRSRRHPTAGPGMPPRRLGDTLMQRPWEFSEILAGRLHCPTDGLGNSATSGS